LYNIIYHILLVVVSWERTKSYFYGVFELVDLANCHIQFSIIISDIDCHWKGDRGQRNLVTCIYILRWM